MSSRPEFLLEYSLGAGCIDESSSIHKGMSKLIELSQISTFFNSLFLVCFDIFTIISSYYRELPNC